MPYQIYDDSNVHVTGAYANKISPRGNGTRGLLRLQVCCPPITHRTDTAIYR